MELARGELSERFSNHDWAQGVEEYNQRIYNKTASLFCTAAQSGSLLSESTEEEASALTRYGYNLGMAFQIMDDLLDFQGTEEELGKPVGADLLQGIITLPALLYADSHRDAPIVQRLRGGGSDVEDLERLVELVRESSAIDETFTVMAGYREQAREALMELSASRSRESLEALTEYIGERRS
jgi:geranylgeranyl pyrophosphate synthase